MSWRTTHGRELKGWQRDERNRRTELLKDVGEHDMIRSRIRRSHLHGDGESKWQVMLQLP